jgi:hypothetical protein
LGATAALLVLAACGILASIGAIDAPTRIGGSARQLLGFSSPFRRNYGLNVPFDSVALLVPLSVPWLLLTAVSARRRERVLATVSAGALLFAAAFVFQAREMLAQFAVAGLMTVVVVRPRVGAIMAGALAPLLIAGAIKLATVDQTSSDVRIANTRYVVSTIVHSPQTFLAGSDENAFFLNSVKSSPNLVAALRASYGPPTSSSYAIHNFFLSNLVAGGIAAFALTALMFSVVMHHALRAWQARPQLFASRALVVAGAVVLVTLLLEPVRANAVGNWLLAGVILGTTVGEEATHRASRRARPLSKV